MDGFSKTIRNVEIERQELTFTEPVKTIVGAMDVFQNFDEIQDLNYTGFLSFTKEFATLFTDEAFEEVNRIMKYEPRKSTC